MIVWARPKYLLWVTWSVISGRCVQARQLATTGSRQTSATIVLHLLDGCFGRSFSRRQWLSANLLLSKEANSCMSIRARPQRSSCILPRINDHLSDREEHQISISWKIPSSVQGSSQLFALFSACRRARRASGDVATAVHSDLQACQLQLRTTVFGCAGSLLQCLPRDRDRILWFRLPDCSHPCPFSVASWVSTTATCVDLWWTGFWGLYFRPDWGIQVPTFGLLYLMVN